MEDRISQIIAYYRVSTRKQGESGLGLDAQRKAVQDLAKREGAKIIAEFTEIESGKRSDRVEIAKAISRTRAEGGTLAIANISRLARNVAFTACLQESGVSFVCCDNPRADAFTIHILASVAEKEARDTSTRTIAALEAAKRKGVKLGCQNRKHQRRVPADWRRKGTEKGLPRARRKAAANAAQRRSDRYTPELLADMASRRNAGETYQAIADQLNADGKVTVRKKPFAAMTVKRMLA